jgi:hypothetical protein
MRPVLVLLTHALVVSSVIHIQGVSKGATANSLSIQTSSASDATQPLPPGESIAPAIMSADSAPKLSGQELQWSRWYRLGVGKAPAGYTVSRVEFWLTGYNACVSSAECREVIRNDHEVLWQFRLRGHGGTRSRAQRSSVAHIRVFYRSQDNQGATDIGGNMPR